MSIFDVFLNSELGNFKANGFYKLNLNEEYEFQFNNIEPNNNNFKELIKKVLIEYIEDMNFNGNIKGNLENYITNNKYLDIFYNSLNKENIC